LVPFLLGCGSDAAQEAASEDQIEEYIKQNPDIEPTEFMNDSEL
jgi:hypothetical protein